MASAEDLRLTPEKYELFQKFKEKVKDVTKPDHDDFFLIKWMKARNFDIPKAEKMFRDNQEWRKKNDIDALSTSEYKPEEVLQKYVACGAFGATKKGYPLFWELIPNMDQKGFYNSVTKKEFIRFRLSQAEHLMNVTLQEHSKKAGKRIEKFVVMVDLEGFGLKHLWLPGVEVYSELFAIAEANYPDRLRAVYVVNAPSIFPVAYGLVKRFLSEDTRKRIQILGGNYKEHLLKEIDADQLPAHWGGTAKDPDGDPYCKSKICLGGPIPESYYKMNTLTENTDLSKFTTATVQKGSTLQLDFSVKVKNSLLRWNFYTDDNDIGFGVFRRTNPDQRQKAGDMSEVVPSERVKSHVIPEAGSVICESPGTYVVRFDNNYSWINAKKLYYLIEVVEPDALKDLDSTKF